MKTTKSVVIAACLAISSLAVAACGGSTSSEGSSESAADAFGECKVGGKFGEFKLQPSKDGALTVKAPMPAGAGFTGTKVSDIKSGYLYCLAADIAHRGGLPRLNLVNASLDSLLAGTVRDFDIAPYDLYITPERTKVSDFSVAYASSVTGVMVEKGADVTEANIRDKRIGVVSGGTQFNWVKSELKPTDKISTYPAETELYTALRAGQIDVALLDATSTMPQTKRSGGLFETIATYAVGGDYGILLPKDSPNTPVVNEIIEQMLDDGSMAGIYAKFLDPVMGGNPKDLPVWTTG